MSPVAMPANFRSFAYTIPTVAPASVTVTTRGIHPSLTIDARKDRGLQVFAHSPERDTAVTYICSIAAAEDNTRTANVSRLSHTYDASTMKSLSSGTPSNFRAMPSCTAGHVFRVVGAAPRRFE